MNAVESVGATLTLAGGRWAYYAIPACEIRGFFDRTFQTFAKSRDADVVAGAWHRYRGGHDLLLDIPTTAHARGMARALSHAGHILLTDFPTRQGIPIPGLSESGLGHVLTGVGIPHPWLNLNICEAGIGFWAIQDATGSLHDAVNGLLKMDGGTFAQTFVSGGSEVLVSLSIKNPLLLVAGIEKLCAGLVSTWKTYAVQISPLELFGPALVPALFGFGLSAALTRGTLTDHSVRAIKSGAVSTLFHTSPLFGVGALLGLSAYGLGRKLAALHGDRRQALLTVNAHSYNRLVEELCRGNPHVAQMIVDASPRLVFPADGCDLAKGVFVLDSRSGLTLASDYVGLDSGTLAVLEAECAPLDMSPGMLLA